MTEKIQQPPKAFKLPYKKIKDYFSADTTPMEFEDTVIKALKAWFEHNQEHDNEHVNEHDYGYVEDYGLEP